MITILLASSLLILNVYGELMYDGCDIDSRLDVVFVVDQACGMSETVCANYLNGVFEYILSIKKYSDPRVAYFDMQSVRQDPFISLHNSDFNDLTDADKFLTTTDAMQSKITDQDCYKGDLETPDVQDSINKAITELNAYSIPDRVKKIVIISNCKDPDSIDVCNAFEDEIEVEITVVNIANPVVYYPTQITESERDLYLTCLTQNDPTRLLSAPSTDENDMVSIVYDFWNEICETEEPQTTKTTECSSDADCPTGLVCCTGPRKICHPPPAAKSIIEGAVYNVPDVKETPFKYDKNMYGYILLIGFIAFILVNNIFIGCWCVRKKSDLQYEKCEVEVVNQ